MTRRSLKKAPDAVRAANAANNAEGRTVDRQTNWESARDECWALVAPLFAERSEPRVAIVGAGNANDIPLRRIVERAACVDLFDIDVESAAGARERMPSESHARIAVIEHDVTLGAADTVIDRAARGAEIRLPAVHQPQPLGEGEYDIVIGDLFYSQLLYPALRRTRIEATRRGKIMSEFEPLLVAGAVARMHASLADAGHAVHIHDLAMWANDKVQPMSLDAALIDPDAAVPQLDLAAHCDPLRALNAAGIGVQRWAYWRWPFYESREFLVRGLVT